ncbi:tetratricopeptide repeat protein [Almyronema epifaneia]|uniref:Tetratricopeptide repeat protein n=1 Tax=Almyronema epifaneia S1 TaxID=2991925 RepID=A0ABW6IEP3_9CYAN
MSSSAFRTHLHAYSLAIEALARSPVATDREILEALLSRDRLQALLNKGTRPEVADVLQLNAKDSQLKAQQAKIQACPQLEDWHTLFRPHETAWWWALPPDAAAEKWSQRDRLWNVLSLVFLTLSASLILNTASRFWRDGLETAGTIAVVTQAVVTLIAGRGAFTDSGREAWEQFLRDRGVPAYQWQEWSCAASGAVFVGVAAIHGSLPWVAIGYNHWGVEHYRAGRLSSALNDYQTAIALRPDYEAAHYHLGLLYEDLLQTEDAIAQYQFVVQSSPAEVDDKVIWLKAINNLGRLYILQADPQAAILPLLRGIEQITADVTTDADLAEVNYTLLKNLGWARLEQKRYSEAQDSLNDAIALDTAVLQPLTQTPGDRAAAHCLLAQVLDAAPYASTAEADTAWETCFRFANPANPDEDAWIGLYETRQPEPQETEDATTP